MIYKRYRRSLDKILKTLCMGWFFGFFLGLFVFDIPTIQEVKANIVDPTAVNPENIQKIMALPTPKVVANKKIKDYYPLAKSLFGKEWKIALAVAEAECNSNRRDWPRCVNSWGDSPETGEYSVGWGQINIARMRGLGNKVHWDKIPGDNLKEKEEWLKNPENNLLAMYMIWIGRGKTFEAWTAYTNGNYKTQLEKI